MHNGFRFTLTSNGNYSVSTLLNKIDTNISRHIGIKIKWSKVIPLKIHYCASRAALDRLPVAANLMARGIKVQSNICPICNIDQESNDHLLVRCGVAKEAPEWILRWCGV